MKTYSVLLAWNDNDREQGEFGTIVRANDPEEAERKARAEMRSSHIENHTDSEDSEEEIAESCAEYEREDIRGETIFGGSVLDLHEGAIWKAADLEAALRGLLEWANAMGGWDAPAWKRAESIIADIDKIGAEDAEDEVAAFEVAVERADRVKAEIKRQREQDFLADRAKEARTASHTPGPWWRDDDGYIVAGDGDSYVTLADFDSSSDVDIDEREANKALAIAAPAMHALLQDAMDEWPQFDRASEPLAPGCIIEDDAEVNGGDMVEWFGNWRAKVKELLR